MNSLLSKINRKRQYFDRALKRVLLIAQLLEATKKDIDYKIVLDPIIKFKDGLPIDMLEQAQIFSLRSGKETISQKTAIMHLDGLTEEQAQAELDRMHEEAKAEATVQASIFNENNPDDSGSAPAPAAKTPKPGK